MKTFNRKPQCLHSAAKHGACGWQPSFFIRKVTVPRGMCKVMHRNCEKQLLGAALDCRNGPAAARREGRRRASALLEAREGLERQDMVTLAFGLLGTGQLGSGKLFAPDTDSSLTSEMPMGHAQKAKQSPPSPPRWVHILPRSKPRLRTNNTLRKRSLQ